MNEQGINILIIEDNKADADLILYSFKKNKIKNRIFVIYDGESAIKYLLKNDPYLDADTPDIILLDLNLPRVHGHEVLKVIKENERLKSIPTIVLSTSYHESDIKQAYQNYANAYLVKPINFDDFLNVISKFDSFWLNIVKYPKGGE